LAKKAPPEAVANAFNSYPPAIRKKLLAVRALIFETASATQGVGEIEETLKWGEPAYLTSQSKSGSTIRIAWKAKQANQYVMYFNCQTTLVDDFREQYGHLLRFEGNRAIVFSVDDSQPVDVIRLCIKAALTYHLDKAK
jgi:hypothetical protein